MKPWLQWIITNALGEMIGLGLTFAAGVGLFIGLEPKNFFQAVLLVFLMTATGIIEGCVLGYAQWVVLRRVFPEIQRRTWILATLAGALAAWFLGSLPSSMMGLQSGAESASSEAMQEPSTLLMMVMAAGMGLVLGLVLAFPQWRLLRKHTSGAAWWFPANSLGWALGMLIIFSAVDLAYNTGTVAMGIIVMALALLLTGAVVGAVHGWVLVNFPKSTN